MCVISRHVGESVRIGDVVVRIVKNYGGTVKLGITAPPEVNIVRTEIDPEAKPND